MIKELLDKKIETLEDIANFHQKFEHIPPFQNGNERQIENYVKNQGKEYNRIFKNQIKILE